jgi:hypothetical protein
LNISSPKTVIGYGWLGLDLGSAERLQRALFEVSAWNWQGRPRALIDPRVVLSNNVTPRFQNVDAPRRVAVV